MQVSLVVWHSSQGHQCPAQPQRHQPPSERAPQAMRRRSRISRMVVASGWLLRCRACRRSGGYGKGCSPNHLRFRIGSRYGRDMRGRGCEPGDPTEVWGGWIASVSFKFKVIFLCLLGSEATTFGVGPALAQMAFTHNIMRSTIREQHHSGS